MRSRRQGLCQTFAGKKRQPQRVSWQNYPPLFFSPKNFPIVQTLPRQRDTNARSGPLRPHKSPGAAARVRRRPAPPRHPQPDAQDLRHAARELGAAPQDPRSDRGDAHERPAANQQDRRPKTLHAEHHAEVARRAGQPVLGGLRHPLQINWGDRHAHFFASDQGKRSGARLWRRDLQQWSVHGLREHEVEGAACGDGQAASLQHR